MMENSDDVELLNDDGHKEARPIKNGLANIIGVAMYERKSYFFKFTVN
jgi:hypothetical protein